MEYNSLINTWEWNEWPPPTFLFSWEIWMSKQHTKGQVTENVWTQRDLKFQFQISITTWVIFVESLVLFSFIYSIQIIETKRIVVSTTRDEVYIVLMYSINPFKSKSISWTTDSSRWNYVYIVQKIIISSYKWKIWSKRKVSTKCICFLFAPFARNVMTEEKALGRKAKLIVYLASS